MPNPQRQRATPCWLVKTVNPRLRVGLVRPHLSLAMANLGPHAALLLTEFAPALACSFGTHTILRWGGWKEWNTRSPTPPVGNLTGNPNWVSNLARNEQDRQEGTDSAGLCMHSPHGKCSVFLQKKKIFYRRPRRSAESGKKRTLRSSAPQAIRIFVRRKEFSRLHPGLSRWGDDWPASSDAHACYSLAPLPLARRKAAGKGEGKKKMRDGDCALAVQSWVPPGQARW